jgi:response regulator RpfG family c-di-GMP phosphodiesterase
MAHKILLVDDEEHVLSGFKRNLRTHFEVFTAAGGKLGLETIKHDGPFAVVVSDFKMPEMNGNQFLANVKDIAPDTVRMMLTGYADLPTTIDAVNEGNIFRLLTKPCSNEKLISTLNDGVKQYKLITAEKELLDKTLKGTIRVLIEILSSVNPVAFSRVSRFQKFINPISDLLNIHDKWELEVSILLSQIGLVTMPAELLNRKYTGEHLDNEQEKLFNSHPAIGKSLLSKIPRLEKISEAVFYQFHSYSENTDNAEPTKYGEALPLVSRILKVLNCFDTLISAGFSGEEAYVKLKEREEEFDPNVLIALDASIAGIYSNLRLLTVNIKDVEPGVVVATDIKDKYGQVLITKGAEITEILKMKLLNYVKLGHVDEQIKILK